MDKVNGQRRRFSISRNARDSQNVLSGQKAAYLHHGDCRSLLAALPDKSVQLIITSPPYNVGKEYEARQTTAKYLDLQREVIGQCARVLKDNGSICWEVGNQIIDKGQILPLDIALHPIFNSHNLKMRNRIVWHFEHGLHCKQRFSGRYEVIVWYTKTDNYAFNLDPVRVPQKYPGKKYFKGPNAGKLSGNPLGKNPSDVWVFPNVKHNHREKTVHPCQFPIELVDRLVLALTNESDIILDPFAGVSSALAAALLRKRRALGAEIMKDYVRISRKRIRQAIHGTLPTRPTGQPVYKPNGESTARLPLSFQKARQNADS